MDEEDKAFQDRIIAEMRASISTEAAKAAAVRTSLKERAVAAAEERNKIEARKAAAMEIYNDLFEELKDAVSFIPQRIGEIVELGIGSKIVK